MRKILEKIDLVRHERDMTQEELESSAGLACGRVSKWRDGKGEPSASQAWKIARSLGVSAEWLINDDARMEDWTKRDGLLPIETHILHLASRLGQNEAAVLLTDALTGGGGKAAKTKPPDKPQGPGSTRPTPTVHEHDVTPPHDGRRRTRRRKPKGGNSSSTG